MTRLKKQGYVLLVVTLIFASTVNPVQAQGPTPFANCRLGVGGVGNDITGYDIEQLNVGLYSDWWVNDPPPAGRGAAPSPRATRRRRGWWVPPPTRAGRGGAPGPAPPARRSRGLGPARAAARRTRSPSRWRALVFSRRRRTRLVTAHSASARRRRWWALFGL